MDVKLSRRSFYAPARESGPIPPQLLRSWQRSEQYGVPVETVDPVFAGVRVDDSLFLSCGREVLHSLTRGLAEEPISLMLTDADGVVLNRFSGDHALLRALDADHLAPGFSFAEREAGTNGLGLALADRAPVLVRAKEHYALSLCRYTCAAAPVFDPVTHQLSGTVNLTTWAETSSDLLLALARSAAGHTSAVMSLRGAGRAAGAGPQAPTARVEALLLEPGAGTLPDLSVDWTCALARVRTAMADGRLVVAVGAPGAGRTTLLAQAVRREHPTSRILAANPPPPARTDEWLDLWSLEAAKPRTTVIVRGIETLPVPTAERLRDLVATRRRDPDGVPPVLLTCERFESVPTAITGLVDTVVEAPPLRDRPADVTPLVRHVAARLRGRPIDVTPAAEHLLESYAWPGNVAELVAVARRAAAHTERIDLRDLPAALLTGSTRRLSRIESFERDEIVRVLTREGVTMRVAAEELGMSRATLYRKIAHLEIHVRGR